MKKVLFAIVMMPFACLAQKHIDGIGALRLGYSKGQIIESLKPEYGWPIPFSSTTYKFENDEYYSALPPDDWYGNSYYICPDYPVYYIPEYKVSGVTISGVKLTFFNDTLIEIHSDCNPDLEDAINAKYGKGVAVLKNKEIQCTYSFTGAVNSYQEPTITTTWDTDDGIVCNSYCNKYYDKDCKPQMMWFISIYKREGKIKVSQCMLEYSKSRKADGEKKKLETLRTKLDKF